MDAQQAAKNDSYSRLVRNDQDIAIRKLALDFVNHAEAARCYCYRQLAGGWRMPGRIGKPTNVVGVIFPIDVFSCLSFPFSLNDLIYIRPRLITNPQRVAEGQGRVDNSPPTA